jgi:hypothetical protein
VERNRRWEIELEGGDDVGVVSEVHTDGVVLVEVQSGWFGAGDELLAWRCSEVGLRRGMAMKGPVRRSTHESGRISTSGRPLWQQRQRRRVARVSCPHGGARAAGQTARKRAPDQRWVWHRLRVKHAR